MRAQRSLGIISGVTTAQKPRAAGDPFAIIPQSLRDVVRGAHAWAQGQLERGERIETHWVIGNAGLKTSVHIPTDTSSEETKDACAQHARRVAQLQQADYVLNIGETWALAPEDVPNYQSILARYGSISNYPRRVDTLHIYLECAEGIFGAMSRIRPMPPSKKRRTLAAPQVLKADESQGRLAGILPASDGSAPQRT